MSEPKTRGRKPKNKTDAVAASQGLADTNERDPNATTRPPRRKMQAGQRLDVPERYLEGNGTDYKYRWFLDDIDRPGRIQSAEAAYWEKVTDEHGSVITRQSGNSTFFLMRLEKQYDVEDLIDKREKVKLRNQVENKLGENEYAPTADGKAEGNTEMLRKQSVSSSADNPFAE